MNKKKKTINPVNKNPVMAPSIISMMKTRKVAMIPQGLAVQAITLVIGFLGRSMNSITPKLDDSKEGEGEWLALYGLVV